MAEQIWMLQTKRADFDGIARQFGIDPVTARVIRNRGIEGREKGRKEIEWNKSIRQGNSSADDKR